MASLKMVSASRGLLFSWALTAGRQFTAGPANYDYFIFLSRGEKHKVC